MERLRFALMELKKGVLKGLTLRAEVGRAYLYLLSLIVGFRFFLCE